MWKILSFQTSRIPYFFAYKVSGINEKCVNSFVVSSKECCVVGCDTKQSGSSVLIHQGILLCCSSFSSSQMAEAARSSEMSVSFYHSTCWHIPEAHSAHSQHLEDLKSLLSHLHRVEMWKSCLSVELWPSIAPKGVEQNLLFADRGVATVMGLIKSCWAGLVLIHIDP